MLTDSTPSSSRVVAALRDLGLRNAGTPLLIASTPVSAAAPWVNERRISSTSASPVNASPSARSVRFALARQHRLAEQEDPHQPPDDHRPDADHERVDRDGEGRARLADPAQVHGREQHDRADRERHLVLGDERHERPDVGRRRRDRHRDRQRVVDEQRAGHGEPRAAAEVDRRDLVVAAARRVGVHVLPVAGDHREQHDHDREADPRRQRVRRGARRPTASGRSPRGRRRPTTSRRRRTPAARSAWTAGCARAGRCVGAARRGCASARSRNEGTAEA